ncbi:MAG: SDR family NAD(P)-dependent oxidoreductase [Alphaproteobacteria bacterium]
MPHGYGKTALITGASMGIGRELSFVFAENGYDLIVVARSEDKLNTLANELYDEFGTTVTVIGQDLSKTTAPQKLFKAVNDAGLHVDVLVNNAGFGAFKPFVETAKTRISDMVQVNVAALTELIYLFAQPMKDKGEGKIMNVASVAAFNPTPGAALYGATKAFVLSLTEALSEEMREDGITLTALCPGLTETEFSKNATGKKAENGSVPDFMKLNAKQVAKEGFDALHAGEVVRVNGIAYQLGVEWMRYTPRAMVRAMSGMFSKQLEDGF